MRFWTIRIKGRVDEFLLLNIFIILHLSLQLFRDERNKKGCLISKGYYPGYMLINSYAELNASSTCGIYLLNKRAQTRLCGDLRIAHGTNTRQQRLTPHINTDLRPRLARLPTSTFRIPHGTLNFTNPQITNRP